jgi:hypothetical protein
LCGDAPLDNDGRAAGHERDENKEEPGVRSRCNLDRIKAIEQPCERLRGLLIGIVRKRRTRLSVRVESRRPEKRETHEVVASRNNWEQRNSGHEERCDPAKARAGNRSARAEQADAGGERHHGPCNVQGTDDGNQQTLSIIPASRLAYASGPIHGCATWK